jgi:hypothetical protein
MQFGARRLSQSARQEKCCRLSRLRQARSWVLMMMIRTETMAAAKFAMNDAIRFIGTDTPLTVKQYDEGTRQYQVQRGDDGTSAEWVPEIYLELLDQP